MDNDVLEVGIVHLVVAGRTWDIPMDDLDIGFATPDAEIKQRMADFADVPVTKLENNSVERNELTNVINLTPHAIFGN